MSQWLRAGVVVASGLLTSFLAHAWEVDQLTDRGSPPPDVTAVANAEAERVLDQALADLRPRLRCGGTPVRCERAFPHRSAEKLFP